MEREQELLRKQWPQWTIVEQLGEGSFGKVFKIEREDLSGKFYSALKVISVPRNETEYRHVLSEMSDEKSVTAYFRSVMEEIVNEFVIMERLKGHSNIVNYEDHAVIRHENDPGYDILIRMELLTPLSKYIASHPMDDNEVSRMGKELCEGLAFCHSNNIIHRDIKPDNVFVSSFGKYKLGDFGIARTVEKSISAMSKKGTYNYMAPEVYRGMKYDKTVDIYSLGIMMYRYLNDNREPFLEEKITYNSKERALERRMSGEAIPRPKHGSDDLARIVLKACAFRPVDRFSSAVKMRDALLRLERKNRTDDPTPYFDRTQYDDMTCYDDQTMFDDRTQFEDARSYQKDQNYSGGAAGGWQGRQPSYGQDYRKPPEPPVNQKDSNSKYLIIVLSLTVVLAILLAIILLHSIFGGRGGPDYPTTSTEAVTQSTTTEAPEATTVVSGYQGAVENWSETSAGTYVTNKSYSLEEISMYASPDDTERSTYIEEALVVQVLGSGHKNGRNWCYVDYFGKKGWVHEDDLRYLSVDPYYFQPENTVFVNALNGVYLHTDATKKSSKTKKRYPYGTELLVTEVKNGFAHSVIDGQDVWLDMNYGNFYATEDWQVEICDGKSKEINLRSKKSTKSESLAKIPSGTVLHFSKTESGWGRTSYHGKSGWVQLHRMTPCMSSGIWSEDQ